MDIVDRKSFIFGHDLREFVTSIRLLGKLMCSVAPHVSFLFQVLITHHQHHQQYIFKLLSTSSLPRTLLVTCPRVILNQKHTNTASHPPKHAPPVSNTNSLLAIQPYFQLASCIPSSPSPSSSSPPSPSRLSHTSNAPSPARRRAKGTPSATERARRCAPAP